MEEVGAEFMGKGHNLTRVIDQLEKKMGEAAANLEFKTAARMREQVKKLRDVEIGRGVECVMGGGGLSSPSAKLGAGQTRLKRTCASS